MAFAKVAWHGVQQSFQWSATVRRRAAEFLQGLERDKLKLLYESMTRNLARNKRKETLIQGITQSDKRPHHLLDTCVFDKSTLKKALEVFLSVNVVEVSSAAHVEGKNLDLFHLKCKVLMLWGQPEVGHNFKQKLLLPIDTSA